MVRHYPASSVPLTLSDSQMVRRPFRRRSRFATPRPSRASPNYADYLSDVLCPLPRWTVSVHDGYRVDALPRRVLPDPFRLPRKRAGSASTLQLSRPAQALLALRPAGLLAHLSVDFVARFRSAPLPVLTARQLSNLTINYSSGSFPHWYSAPEGHTHDPPALGISAGLITPLDGLRRSPGLKETESPRR